MLRAGANTGPLIFGVNVDYSDNQQALRNVEGKQRPLSLLKTLITATLIKRTIRGLVV
jgi:hypothetical protein